MTDPAEMVRRQRALAEFGDYVLDHESLDEILAEACRLVAEALDAPLAHVIEVEEDLGRVRAGFGWRPGVVGEAQISLHAHSLEAHTIQAGEPVIANDVRHEHRFVLQAFVRQHKVVALVTAPILLPGRRLWGVLQVSACAARRFGREDVESLKTYAMVLGPVIDRVRVAAEREQALNDLQAREERLARVLEGMGEGFGLVAPDFTILGHNRHALQLDGRTAGEIVGRSLWEVYPGSEHSELGQLLRQAMAERVPVQLEHRYVWVDGRARWIEMHAYPTAEGALAVFWRDVTDRRETEDALHESDARYRALFETMDQASAVVEVLKDEAGRWSDFRFIEVNPAFMAHTSMPWPVGKTATELLGTPNPRWAQLYGEALDTGTGMRVEEDEPTLGRTFDLNIFSLDRARNRVAVMFTDVTERKRAEAALRASEARLTAAFESAPVGVAVLDTTGKTVIANAEFSRFLPDGTMPSQNPVRGWRWRAWDSEGRPVAPEDFPGARALRGERVVPGVEMLYTQDDGREIWTSVASVPIRGEGDQIMGLATVVTDIDARKRSVERQKLLLAELQHRVRNILAMVRSVIRRTVETGESLEDVAQHLEGRIGSLARTQSLLTRAPGAGIDLETLIREELLAQRADDDAIVLEGPDVDLAPKAAEVLTLAIHELATNATKYGAFAQPGGSLHVQWSVNPSEDGVDRVRLLWLEQGVSVVSCAPRRFGFGTELIEKRVPYELKGEGSIELRPGGVRVEISFPLVPGESILATDLPRRFPHEG